MKPALIAAAVVAAALIATVQQIKLSDLNAETARLEAGKNPSPVKHADRSIQAETQQEATTEQFEHVRETLIEVVLSYQDRTGRRDPERIKRLLLAAGNFSANDIAQLIPLLSDDPRLAGIDADRTFKACRKLFSEIAPFAWRDYLAAHRDLPGWQDLFDAAVANCLRADDKRALAMIEQETAKGNPEVATSGIRSSVLLALADSDPDKMLARAISPEFTADPDALFKLGGFVDDKLETPADHLRFLAALRRAQKKNPSPVLAEIRKDYVNEMANGLYQWPAVDAISLISSEFTPAERFHVAEQCASRIDLSDPEKWINWFLKIDPAEWSEWSKREGNPSKHPLVRQIASRSIQDSEEPARWLGMIPPGELREQATLEHAWTIADRDPDRAASYLAKLPDSKGKQNLIKKIGAARGAQRK
jgi:hypothetical protein